MTAQCTGCGRYYTSDGLTLHKRKCVPWKDMMRKIRRNESLLNPRKLHMMHMGVEKNYLLEHVMPREDWREFFENAPFVSRAEAIKSIVSDPRTVFCSCACRKNADGSCSGEPVQEESHGT